MHPDEPPLQRRGQLPVSNYRFVDTSATTGKVRSSDWIGNASPGRHSTT
jgi:hypothetical protein